MTAAIPSYARPTLGKTKRLFDVVASGLGLALFGWLIAAAAIAARIDTGASGIFRQKRIGRGGVLFTLFKIRTMRPGPPNATTATAANDPRITPLGRLLRRSKIDELPQLWNVLVGEMSLVGPRPEVPQHLDRFLQTHPDVLRVRPGITCPATLLYRNEETLLAAMPFPDAINESVLLPHKLRLNEAYARSYTFNGDLVCIWRTLSATGPRLTRLDDLPRGDLTPNDYRDAA
ncbi:putative undecaprenyl-phosphate N-acetylgalactosaminyl 1-phosphate transferase [Botrimarina colliarenosi]|uniref:Putative undecaprenyl-phosphate N-acetylgalactosaminyl 1-phosphate transferase n=1 Tax=Botrimarina colliarenosi TaxID=2528001 RepID=A0A5C6AHL7_9BACT|nr:sugar transferase [Botrimarina colliarenosi]TWT99494.1 putative undecaprenyl-phosphate N-acetylgalactosaminyl 1-phosphate transferase [Botrimarina colliarenosi]